MNLSDLTLASTKLLETEKARFLREAQAKGIHPLTISGFLNGLSAGWAFALRTAFDLCRAEAVEAARAESEAVLAKAKADIEAAAPSSKEPEPATPPAPHANGSAEASPGILELQASPPPYEER